MFKGEINRLNVAQWVLHEVSVKQEKTVIRLVLQIDVELNLRLFVIDDKPIKSASCKLINLIEVELQGDVSIRHVTSKRDNPRAMLLGNRHDVAVWSDGVPHGTE